MLKLSTTLDGTEHNEDPDSPRSPQAPTAAAAPHSMQPAQSPGYHSNSDYRPSAVNHHIINTYTQMASRCGGAHARQCRAHALAREHTHSYSRTNVCARPGAHTFTRPRTILSLFSRGGSAKCSSLWANLPPKESSHGKLWMSTTFNRNCPHKLVGFLLFCKMWHVHLLQGLRGKIFAFQKFAASLTHSYCQMFCAAEAGSTVIRLIFQWVMRNSDLIMVRGDSRTENDFRGESYCCLYPPLESQHIGRLCRHCSRLTFATYALESSHLILSQNIKRLLITFHHSAS